MTLLAEKFLGTATFTLNRCLSSEKRDCFYRLDRVDPFEMSRYIEVIHLEECVSCIVLIKI